MISAHAKEKKICKIALILTETSKERLTTLKCKHAVAEDPSKKDFVTNGRNGGHIKCQLTNILHGVDLLLDPPVHRLLSFLLLAAFVAGFKSLQFRRQLQASSSFTIIIVYRSYLVSKVQ